jgi:hypothetical protein
MGSQMAGQPDQSGESPLDSQRDRGPQDREQTPEAPPEEAGGKPEEKPGEKPEGKPGGEEPEKPDASEEPGENREGSPQEEEAGDPVPSADDAERWGMLPQRTQEIFRNQGRDDLPVQYREWIDAYYRELNRTRASDR